MSFRGKPVIGMVGGIGSGKSAVASMLRDLGCHVTDSDRLARKVIDLPDVRKRLRDWWGPRVFAEDGSVDRHAVASIVFNSDDERQRLENLLHPLIESERMKEWSEAPAMARAFVIDAPLLLEAGLDRQCDAIIYVDTPRALRLERLRAARGWDEDELSRREKSQVPLDAKRIAAHHVVQNTGDLDQLRSQVEHVFAMIVAASRR